MSIAAYLTSSHSRAKRSFHGPSCHREIQSGLRLLLALALLAGAAHASTNDTTGTRSSVKLDADPINFATGEYTLRETLAALGGPLPLDFQLFYGSVRNTRRLPDGLPFKFAHNLHGFLVHDTAAGQIALEPGLADEISFAQSGTNWVVAGNEAVALQLLESGDFYYVCDPVSEIVSIYRRSATNGTEVAATLRARLDRNGNRLLYGQTNDPDIPGPLQVGDTRGRSFTLAYNVVGVSDTNRYLTHVTDHGARQWRFEYVENPPDAPGRVTLRRVVDPAGRTNEFRYATNGFHFLHSVTLPRGNTPSRQSYRGTQPEDNFRGVVISQTDARSNRWDVKPEILAPFENPFSRLTLTQPDGTTRGYLHDHAGRVVRRFTDEEGRAVEYQTDLTRDVLTGVKDRRGHTTTVSHHASGKLARLVNALGGRTDFTYTSRTQLVTNPLNLETIPFVFHDLTRVDYPDGSFEELTYDARGNVTVFRDQAGALTRYGYNAAGQVTALTNALGGVTTLTYDAAGNLQTVTDSDGVSLAFGYDALFRLTSVTNADGSVIRHERDARDLLTALVDEHGVRTEFAYDANRKLTNVIRAAGTAIAQTNRLEYDDLDRIVRLVDPAGFATTFAHTYRGALAEATFADGARIRAGYDRRQFPVELVDEAGKTVRVARDGEGLPTFLITPAGRRFQAVFDAQGFPTELFDGLTNRFRLAYDPLQRLTNAVDRLGRGLAIQRDAAGRITALRLPVIGTVSYARNGLGQITNLTDFRGATWRLDHTPMGRLKELRDPLGQLWTFAYDHRGRLARVTAPDGVVETNRYDAVGSLVGRHFSDGLQLDFARDALRRLTNTASVPVGLGYDGRNLPTAGTMHGVTFSATHDARGRLATLDYGGLTTLTYTYDARGLVTRVHDSRTGAFVEMEYDDDRFLRRIKRSNGVNTDFERDANGAVTRIHHVGKADLRLTRNAGSEITRLATTGLPDLAAFLPDEALSFIYDPASQPAAAGFAHDARGRRTRDPQRGYAWDAADRLVAFTNGPTVVEQQFTARGDVAVETVNGTATEFFYHDAVGGRPLLAERRAGNFRRYHVFTPGGALLFAVNLPANAPAFHHFNHAGTTVLLTDASGAVTDTYGYTPYGRPIRHEGASDQPFTFNGQFGVRQIAGTALFHMRARFYDCLTARFLSRDPSWLGLLEAPGDLNPYGFARQNPVSFADPLGRQSIHINERGEPIDPDPGKLPDGTLVGKVDEAGHVTWQVVQWAYGPKGDGWIGAASLKDFEGTGPFQCVKLPGSRSLSTTPSQNPADMVASELRRAANRPLAAFNPVNLPAVKAFQSEVQPPPRARPPGFFNWEKLAAEEAERAERELRFERELQDMVDRRTTASCDTPLVNCPGMAQQNMDALRQAGYKGPFSILNTLPIETRAVVLRLLPLAALGALWLGLRWKLRRRAARR
jgi:RHS repeat-associated protein